MSDVQLKVDGKIYLGWTEMKVQRGIEQAAGAFALQLTERWPGQVDRWVIEPGAECMLLIDGHAVITGYVDSSERFIDATTHRIKVVGRDKAGDIVDCTAMLPNEKTGDINKLTLLKRANLLCKPFDITVTDNAGVATVLPKRGIETYETVWENIERGARELAVLIISDGLGGLVITRAGENKNPNALKEGQNILSASLLRDDSNRFGHYIILGQSPGNDFGLPSHSAQKKEKVTDDAIRRYRPMMMEADDLADGVSLNDRVRWERNIRRARSRRLTVTVPGFSANGRLWQRNEMVNVSIPTLGIEGWLLVVSVIQTLTEQGSQTEMLLSPKEAYELLPEAVEKTTGALNVSSDTLELLQ